MKDKSRKIIFITFELFAGLIFGIIGGYIYSLFDRSHITSFVLHTFIIIYLTSLLGIFIPGFIHCINTQSRDLFLKSALLSFVGLILFLGLYVLLEITVLKNIPNSIANLISPIVIPIIGAVIGFNIIPKKSILVEHN